MPRSTVDIWLDHNDIALHELVDVRVFHIDFAKAQPSQNRAIVLGMDGLVRYDYTASPQSKTNVPGAFADTSWLSMCTQISGKFFSIKWHNGT